MEKRTSKASAPPTTPQSENKETPPTTKPQSESKPYWNRKRNRFIYTPDDIPGCYVTIAAKRRKEITPEAAIQALEAVASLMKKNFRTEDQKLKVIANQLADILLNPDAPSVVQDCILNLISNLVKHTGISPTNPEVARAILPIALTRAETQNLRIGASGVIVRKTSDDSPDLVN